MNSQGRHYRDQSDPENPSCDYELNGARCTFFTNGHEHAELPYPTDISIGPVTDSPSQSSSDMATILSLLQQQKEAADQQREQVNRLQEQVSSLLQRDAASSTSVTHPATTFFSSSALSSVTTTSSFSTPSLHTFTTTSAPQVVSSAAASLSAALQGGLGRNQANTYTGLTMEHLRTDPALVSQAAAVLASATNQIPSLNPLGNTLEGMGNLVHSGGPHQQNQVISSVDQLYRATTVNKQLRCYEFAATGQFSYRNQLRQDNCNAVTFAFGAFKHLEACKSGLINVSNAKFLSRLRHLKNVFEIACLSSKLDSFTEHSWLVAREYDSRVIADIESGAKAWDNLSVGIEPDAIYCAKETVEIRSKIKKPKDPKDEKPDDKKHKKLCTTFNTHRSSEGCYWEHTNQGQTCVFDHYCSWCKQNRDVVEKHKVLNCEHKTEQQLQPVVSLETSLCEPSRDANISVFTELPFLGHNSVPDFIVCDPDVKNLEFLESADDRLLPKSNFVFDEHKLFHMAYIVNLHNRVKSHGVHNYQKGA